MLSILKKLKNRIKLAVTDTCHTLDTLVFVDDGHFFFLPDNRLHRTASETEAAFCAKIRVDFEFQQGNAALGGAALVVNVRVVFVPEVPQGGQNRVGRGLPQPAQRGGLDRLANFF